MGNRYLIINADDFGITPSTNEAIRELFDRERITSAGILAPAKYAADACHLAKENGYSVGVHWTLHSEWAGEDAWTPCSPYASSLCHDGKLTCDASHLQRADARQVTAELDEQYRFLQQCGCTPDHADSHGGTLYGINGRLFFLNAYALCRKYRLPFRFSQSDGFLRRQFGAEPSVPLKAARRAVSACGRIMGVSLLDDFFSDPRPIEKIENYSGLKTYYESQLETLTGNICEVFLHPCLPDDVLLNRSSQWQKRFWEYEYLRTGDLCKKAEELGFSLVSWANAPFIGMRQHG